MLELGSRHSIEFYKIFLAMRKKYYFYETKALLSRHKLLLVFFMSVLVPGIKNIPMIGTPFFAVINPTLPIFSKAVYMVSLIIFLLGFTHAQSMFINGGPFREYLNTMYLARYHQKRIDMVLILISLSFVWIGIILGGTQLYYFSENKLAVISYYGLYVAMLSAILVMLLSMLYKNMRDILLLSTCIALIGVVSTIQVGSLNWIVSIGVSIVSVMVMLKSQPKRSQESIGTYKEKIDLKKSFVGLKSYIILQIAVYRRNKNPFLLRFFLCICIAALSFYLNYFEKTFINKIQTIILPISCFSYCASTVFTFLSEDELQCSVFHRIYPSSLLNKHIIEVIMLSGILILSFVPTIILILSKSFLLSCVLGISLIMNALSLFVNRYLYAYSLRYCLFTSTVNTIVNLYIQCLLIGGFLGN